MKWLKNNSLIKTYVILSFLAYIAAIVLIAASKGSLFASFFFTDSSDSGMDFFHSLVETTTRHPYEDYGIIYPPFANMIFYLLSLLVEGSVKANWPADHDGSVYMVGTVDDLRLQQSSFFIFIVFIILMAFLIVCLLTYFFKKAEVPYIYPVSFCIIFSFGVMFAFERGNVILTAFVLMTYFLIKYDSDKKWERELAYIALALSFGFKIYPVIFVVLLLREKRFIDFIKVSIYSAITLIPIHMFEGFRAYKMWIHNIIEFNKGKIPAYNLIFRIVVLVICVVLLFLGGKLPERKNYIYTEKKSYVILLVTLIMYMFINDNYGYILIYMTVPFVFFLVEERNIDKRNIFELIMYLFVLIPYGVNQLTPLLIIIGIIGGILRSLTKIEREDLVDETSK